MLNEKLVIGFFRENVSIENGVLHNSDISIPLSKFSIEEVDPDVSKIITTMNVNEISKPFETIDETSQQPVYKIIKLVNKIDGHKANLQNDYQQLANMYLAKKKEDVLQEWISERQSKTYIRIDDTYANCNFRFESWIK